jgi:hypothetical protein
MAECVPPNQAGQLLCYRLRRVTVLWQRKLWLVQGSKRVKGFVPIAEACGGGKFLNRASERGFKRVGTQ